MDIIEVEITLREAEEALDLNRMIFHKLKDAGVPIRCDITSVGSHYYIDWTKGSLQKDRDFRTGLTTFTWIPGA